MFFATEHLVLKNVKNVPYISMGCQHGLNYFDPVLMQNWVKIAVKHATKHKNIEHIFYILYYWMFGSKEQTGFFTTECLVVKNVLDSLLPNVR